MPTLDRLRVRQFRHISQDTDIRFNPQRNVILGQNGTGKTTLLKLVSMVVRSNLAEMDSESFDVEWWMSFSSTTLHVHARNLREERELPSERPKPRSAHRTHLGPSYSFSYDLELRDHGGLTLLEVKSGEPPRVLVLGQERPNSRLTLGYDLTYALWPMFEPLGGPSELRDAMLRTFGEVVALRSAYRFGEGLDIYHAITEPLGSDLLRNERRPLLQVSRTKTGHSSFNHEFLPRSIVEKLVELHYDPRVLTGMAPELPSSDIAYRRDDFQFLIQACDILDFADCELIFGLIKRDSDAESELDQVTFGNPRFRFTKTDGSIIPDAFLSYGQKRLLAFAYYVDASREIAIVDELVNGFHHRWIGRCLDLCDGRQVFLTSQNPLLLDSLSFASVESAERTFIVCRTQRAPGELERVAWGNIDRPSAMAFFQALEVNFESVSEILRSQGLW